MSDMTSLRVSPRTRDRVNKLAEKMRSQDQAVAELLDHYEATQGSRDTIGGEGGRATG